MNIMLIPHYDNYLISLQIRS
eukprot:SAG11_NODE_33613_length_276_cov_0.807910_1_plen_20_part_10